MKIFKNKHKLKKEILSIKNISFVPTMGGLHKGHVSLIKKSKKIRGKTLVSIFVNPTQFNDKKDFFNYPKNLKKDISLLKRLKVDLVFIPSVKDIYSFKTKNNFFLEKFSKQLCGKTRKGHFEGVLDVMDKLTNLIKPKKIFMGKKDYQQLYLVKNFIENKYKSNVIGCKTIRNKNKLALSSRNFLFNKNELIEVEEISKKFLNLKKEVKKHKNINKFLIQSKKKYEKKFKIKIEYLENRCVKNLKISNKYLGSNIFLSYYFKGVRLIDNF